VTEYLPNALDRVLSSAARGQAPDGFTPTKKSCTAFGIAFGMASRHSMNVIHRKWKLPNVLLLENFFPRIADFGLSELISLENVVDMARYIGMPAYLAGELDNDDAGGGPEDILGRWMFSHLG
jgi:serine/threonine protein kinase